MKPSSSRHTVMLLRRFLRYFWPHKGKLAIGCLAMFAGLALSLAQPIISKKIIDDALMARNVRLLNVLGAVFLVVAVLSYICSTARQYYFTVVQQRVMTNVRRRLVEHILRLPMAFHDQQNPGYLMARADADVGNLAGVMTDKYVQALVDLLTLLGASAMLLALNWRLALLSMTALPLFTWSLVHFGDRMRRLSHENQEAHAIVAGRLQDVFHSAYIIKVFARELGEVRLLIRDMNTFVRSTMRMAVLNMVCNLSMGCAATLAPLAIIWYGGYQVASGDLSIGSLFAFNMYVVYLFSPLRNIYSTVQSMQASVASLQRVYELMDRPGEQLSSDAPTPSANRAARTGVESACGSIEFRDVWFSYRRGQPVLKGLSFAIEPHTTVALVGASGAGKSTIFNLLLRLYDWDNGEVRLEGVDLKEWDSRSLRRVVRIVPQDPFLFNRSIADNIRFGACDATMEEVRRSAHQAHVEDVVNALPEGYNSLIGQRGTMLSAGERQRVSIARALVSNPRVLLLDEATAFLDANTEAEVQEAIRDSVRGRTCLIIAHRLATVVDADRIIVLNEGGVVDHGTHRQLYSRCGLYAGLCDKQFRTKEARLDERCIVEARPRMGVGIA